MIMQNRLADDLPVSGRESNSRRPQGGIPGEALKYAAAIEDYIVGHPAPSLAAAFAVGVVIAWWIKRR
jgi:hypothetical protein